MRRTGWQWIVSLGALFHFFRIVRSDLPPFCGGKMNPMRKQRAVRQEAEVLVYL